MSDIKAEAQVEPDPSATSISNDQTLNDAPGPAATTELSAAPTTSDDTKKAEEKTEADHNGAADKTEEPNRNGGGPYKKRKVNNSRSKLEDLPESNDPEEMRNQVEFYFSDSNLPTDKYLLEQTRGHENKPVDLKVIHNFKRMRRFPSFADLLKAVQTSTTLNVTDDGQITRKTPLSDKFSLEVEKNRHIVLDATMPRSVYIKGFGEEEKTTQTDIEDFIRAYGDFKAVRMRRVNYGNEKGLFKGSVFVEFADEDGVKAFLAVDPKPKYRDNELEIMSKKEYVDMKNQEIKDGKTKANPPREHRNKSDNWNDRRDRDNSERGRGGRGGGNKRGGRDGGRGRGGRGRGRGGRDGGRDRDNGWENKRRSRDDANAGADKAGVKDDDLQANIDQNNKKRARDAQDAGNEAGEAKKVKADEA